VPNRLTPRAAYLRAKADLRPDARVALRIVEDAIADDMDHRYRRRERADGAVIDWSAEGLLVAFKRTGPETGELIDVIDLKDAPGLP